MQLTFADARALAALPSSMVVPAGPLPFPQGWSEPAPDAGAGPFPKGCSWVAPKAEGTCREALPGCITPEGVFPKGWAVLFGVVEALGGPFGGAAAESCSAAERDADRVADCCKTDDGGRLAVDASVPGGEMPIPKGLLAGTEPTPDGSDPKPRPPDPCRLGGADPKPNSADPCLLAGTEPNPKAAAPVPAEEEEEKAAAVLAPKALVPATPNALLGANPNNGSA